MLCSFAPLPSPKNNPLQAPNRRDLLARGATCHDSALGGNMPTHQHDRGYAWVIVATLALTEMVSWGVLYYGFAVFLVPMEQELHWSRARLTGAFSLALLLSGLAAPLVGRLLDRTGPRLPMTAGSLLATFLLLAWSHVSDLLLFYTIWAGLGLAMALVLYEPAFATVAKWFEQKRRQALTTLTLVGGLASVLFTPFNNWLVTQLGWRHALLSLAGLLALTTVLPHALLLRSSSPLPPRTHASGSYATPQVLRSPTFWLLTAALTLAAFLTVATTVHLLPFLLGRGVAPVFAATITGLVGLMQIPGRVLILLFSRWIPSRILTGGIFLLQGGSLLLLTTQQTLPLLAFVALFGMSNGMITILRAARPAELFGSANYGAIAGTMALPITLARAAAPLGLGILYTLLGHYEPIWITLALLGCAASLAALLAERSATLLMPASHSVQSQ